MDVVVVLVVIVLVVAAAATYIVLSSRNARRTQLREPVIPRVAGLKLRPLAEPTPVARVTTPEPAVVAPVPPPPPVVAAPAPLFDLDLDLELEPAVVVPQPPVEIRWSKKFDPRSGTLDDTARLRLIGDLGIVAKEWCVPLLSQAYQEERRPGHRQAALIALTACRSRAAAITFRVALATGDAAERAIAADGLADLEPAQQSNIRRTVERH